jgi:hypothetical protein
MGRGFLMIIGFSFMAITLLLAADYRRRFVVVKGPLQLGKEEKKSDDRLFLEVMESYKESVDSRLKK